MESPETLVQPSNPADRSEQQARVEPFSARRTPSAQGDPVAEQLVLERYRLLERLGAGGFGVVWRARDELLQREVAVKRIWLGAAGNADRGERAAREAHAAARLSHPAIVALYEACPVGDAFYLISELVQGQTLAQLIAAGSLEDRQALAIGLALIDALEHAHARGVIHRDIKPQNVLVPDRPNAPRGRQHLAAAKLTDFGGASLLDEDVLTRTGDVLGTLAYMSPEQSEGREVREHADLYSLALVLYEALSGVNPVRGATPAETARRIGTRLDPLARRRRDLPRELTLALDDALAPRPRDRGTLEDLRIRVQHALAAEGEQATLRRRGSVLPARPRVADQAGLATAVAAKAWKHLREEPQHPAELAEHEHAAAAPEAPAAPAGGLPRVVWLACALALAGWQGASGRPGVGLLLLAALAPLALVPAARAGRVSPLLLGSGLAPLLGLAGLAGAFPALAGQARRWQERLALGALGYWWLTLAGPLLGRTLWLAGPAGTPSRAVWEGSLGQAATHVVGPAFSTGVLLGALLWGAAAVLLPLLVRGRNAALDILATVTWSAALAAAAPRLDAGLHAAASAPSPRGAVLGAVLGGMLAVGARALRGPV
ncbi:MAG TPA: serine/threonine-protein kinase [Solirubrobacteraceae bacterium]